MASINCQLANLGINYLRSPDFVGFKSQQKHTKWVITINPKQVKSLQLNNMIEKIGDSWCCGKQKILLKISVMSPCAILHITKQVPDTPVKHHIGQGSCPPSFILLSRWRPKPWYKLFERKSRDGYIVMAL